MKAFLVLAMVTVAEICNGASNAFLFVPLCRQAKSFTCGVASLQSVLGYYGTNMRQDVIEKKLHTNRSGTQFQRIVAYAQACGLTAQWQTNMTYAQLQQAVDTGTPVIVALQAWKETPEPAYSNDWDDGHYSVAIGYDETNTYFMDPATLGNYTYIPTGEFLERWHDKSKRTTLVNLGIVFSSPAGPKYDPSVRTKME